MAFFVCFLEVVAPYAASTDANISNTVLIIEYFTIFFLKKFTVIVFVEKLLFDKKYFKLLLYRSLHWGDPILANKNNSK